MSYYVIKGKHTIPSFLYLAVASWVVVFGGVSVILLARWSMSNLTHADLFQMLPGPVMNGLDILGAYAALGAFALYLTMWVYWIAAERSSLLVRIGWFAVLLLLPLFGALIYACTVRIRDIKRYGGLQPLPGGTAG